MDGQEKRTPEVAAWDAGKQRTHDERNDGTNAEASAATNSGTSGETSGGPHNATGFPILRTGALLLGCLGWYLIQEKLAFDDGYGDAFGPATWMALMPAMVWLAAQVELALELPTGRGLDALAAIVVLPVSWGAHAWVFNMFEPMLGTAGLWGLAVVLATMWIWLTRWRLRVLREDQEARGGHARPIEWRDVLMRGVGLGEMLIAVLLVTLFAAAMPSYPRYPTRTRVSELILAASSAKTALSEGMQTYGTWSASWMSAITISATGMIAAATVGPTGVITISGTAPTKGAVITMTPTVTTDNKLVWSCTGTPARYMPASCRK